MGQRRGENFMEQHALKSNDCKIKEAEQCSASSLIHQFGLLTCKFQFRFTGILRIISIIIYKSITICK
jgi:hypothetical protein